MNRLTSSRNVLRSLIETLFDTFGGASNQISQISLEISHIKYQIGS